MPSLKGPVPFLDLTEEFKSLENQWIDAIRKTGRTGTFIHGPHVRGFEQELAEYIGVKHAISVANGTDALILSLRALGIGSGDEVITTPYTFFATSEAIDIVGATPVFADVLPENFNIDPASIRTKITENTRAILPVHLFGCPAKMDEIMSMAHEHGLSVIEDGAQAFGAIYGGKHVGGIGDTGCFSFYPTKVLGCYGDGGIITTNRSDVAEHLVSLRNHGATKTFVHTEIGHNSRLDEIQAALLRFKLRDIETAIAGRQAVADIYSQKLKGKVKALPGARKQDRHVYNLYTIRLDNRDQVRAHLTTNRIGSSLCYPEPLHRQKVYDRLQYGPGSLPQAEQASVEALSLPIYPGMPQAHIDRVCEVLISLRV